MGAAGQPFSMGAAGQSFGGGLGVATLVLACLPQTLRSSAPGFTYTKYPSGDTYVSSCYEIYEFHDSEPVLLVRQNNPAYYLTEAYADTNLCGVHGEMGDRVAYLRFDLSDFSFDAVGSAAFRATPDGFPPDMEVRVYAGCEADRLEDAVRYDHQPAGGQLRCTWVGDGDVLRDSTTRGCDLTHDVRLAAGGDLCVKLVGNANAASSDLLYEAAVFWSSDAPDAEHRPWHTDARTHMGFGPGAIGRGSVNGQELTLKPHLRINGSDCGSLFPDYKGMGCGPEFGLASYAFTPSPTTS